LTFVFDRNNQSISISSDVEDGEVSDGFCFGEEALDLDQVLPGGLAGKLVPVVQGGMGVCMVSIEMAEAFVADDVHGIGAVLGRAMGLW
jgi:hypothetical protein